MNPLEPSRWELVQQCSKAPLDRLLKYYGRLCHEVESYVPHKSICGTRDVMEMIVFEDNTFTTLESNPNTDADPT